MFGKKNDQNNKEFSGNSRSYTGGDGHNIIVGSTQLEGKVISESDFRIDGTFKGDLKCDAKVIIGTEGSFAGDITCQNAVIEGAFEGNLNVKEVLYVRESANIKGDVVTGKLVVQSGSIFEVNCRMTESQGISEFEIEEESIVENE
ncbi:bactofilin family protein [Membranihabitans maritimus]|uniref:bactofilin family protein n=1 Tax=Membranihabitans maritimus TaxID=2904244 RepID=UPI001F1D5006|nr:polymer-forming cytoskeletal protein [Membranihabitans maritimus]